MRLLSFNLNWCAYESKNNNNHVATESDVSFNDKTVNDGINDGIIKPVSDTTRQLLMNIAFYVRKHPGRNAEDIARHINHSISTTERHIITLRRLNLIEYTGAKRAGGYYLTRKGEL